MPLALLQKKVNQRIVKSHEDVAARRQLFDYGETFNDVSMGHDIDHSIDYRVERELEELSGPASKRQLSGQLKSPASKRQVSGQFRAPVSVLKHALEKKDARHETRDYGESFEGDQGPDYRVERDYLEFLGSPNKRSPAKKIEQVKSSQQTRDFGLDFQLDEASDQRLARDYLDFLGNSESLNKREPMKKEEATHKIVDRDYLDFLMGKRGMKDHPHPDN